MHFTRRVKFPHNRSLRSPLHLTIMSVQSNRRRSTVRIYQSTPRLRQSHLASPNRIVKQVRKTPAPASSSRKKQETLTQIGYVIYQNPEEDLNLTYDDNTNESMEEKPSTSKRRKIEKQPNTPVSMRQTRSAKKRAAEKNAQSEELPGGVKEEGFELAVEGDRIGSLDASKTLMPPPKTPQSSRRKEVPSSQSPVNTPLSTQSRRSVRDVSRSPLKEKSMNLRREWDSSVRKSVRWAPVLEVADSMEVDNEESQTAMRAPKTALAIPIKLDFTNDRVSASSVGTLDIESIGGFAFPHQMLGKEAKGTTPENQRAKLEVSDSDAEEDDDNDFSVGVDTQATFRTADLGLDGPIVNEDSIPIHKTTQPPQWLMEDCDPAATPKQKCTGLYRFSQEPDLAPDRTPKLPKSTVRLSSLQRPNNTITSYCRWPSLRTASNLSPPSIPRSDSEEASLQLSNDLVFHTQTYRLPETESQFENAWHEYTLSQGLADQALEQTRSQSPQSPPLQNLSPGPSKFDHDSPWDERDEPQLPILPPPSQSTVSRPEKPSYTAAAAIPTSQATTVEITQYDSHPNLHAFSQQILSSSSPSQPPPFLFPLSSPPQSRIAADVEAEAEAEVEWDGVRLTDSQLLPASLMEGSLVGPPTLGEWECE